MKCISIDIVCLVLSMYSMITFGVAATDVPSSPTDETCKVIINEKVNDLTHFENKFPPII